MSSLDPMNMMYDELRSIKKELRTIHDDITTIKEDVSGLKVRASIWGGLTGLFASVITILIKVWVE